MTLKKMLGLKMKKSILNIKKFKFFPFTRKASSDNHVDSFNRLRCCDIDQAPTSAFRPCGAAQRHLGSPATLFKYRGQKDKKTAKADRGQVQSWLKLVKTMSQFGAKGQIAGINIFINGIENVSQLSRYGKAKNWASPARFFRCKDHSENYAIAKYISLRSLGFHSERLRIVWLRTEEQKSQHAVLMVKLSDQTFVLDSRHNNIITDDMLLKEQPICSLNGRHFSVHWNSKKPGGATQAVEHLTRHVKRVQNRENLAAAA